MLCLLKVDLLFDFVRPLLVVDGFQGILEMVCESRPKVLNSHSIKDFVDNGLITAGRAQSASKGLLGNGIGTRNDDPVVGVFSMVGADLDRCSSHSPEKVVNVSNACVYCSNPVSWLDNRGPSLVELRTPPESLREQLGYDFCLAISGTVCYRGQKILVFIVLL